MRFSHLSFFVWVCAFIYFLLPFRELRAAPGDTLKYNVFNKLAAELHGNSVVSGHAKFPARVKLAEKGKEFHKIFGVMKYGCYPGRRCGKWDVVTHVYLTQLSLPEKYQYAQAKIAKGPNKGKRVRIRKGRTEDGGLPVRDYELARWITPFGAMYKSEDNFEGAVSFDLTDFSPLLRDSVEVSFWLGGFYGHKTEGWEITLDFYYVEGTPIRPALKVEPTPWCSERRYTEAWDWYDSGAKAAPLRSEGIQSYGTFKEEDIDAYYQGKGEPVDAEQKRGWLAFKERCLSQRRTYGVRAHKNAEMVRVRLIQTGGGAYQETNSSPPCAEFCPTNRRVYVDDRLWVEERLWNICGTVAMYPQSGTWIFDRSGWCPGDLASVHNYDLAVSPNQRFTLGFELDPFYLKPDRLSSGSEAAYQISGNLIHYGPRNFDLDVSVEDVIAPNEAFWYRRHNPICAEPIVVIRNNGKRKLTSAKVTYGLIRQEVDTLSGKVENTAPPLRTHEWSGGLSFMQSDTLFLSGLLDWQGGEAWFEARVSGANGEEKDDYELNDTYRTRYVPAAVYASDTLKLAIETNYYPKENAVAIHEIGGEAPVFELKDFKMDKMHKPLVVLRRGVCHRLVFSDVDADGLYSFGRAFDGTGTFEIRNPDVRTGEVVKFDPDFGKSIVTQFAIHETAPESPQAPGVAPEEEEEPEEGKKKRRRRRRKKE